MPNKIFWLRLSYWAGAIVDAFFALAMIFPPILQKALRLPPGEMGIETRAALGMAASLMLGWTCLLLWANAKPIERRGVLILTVIPVLCGLALTTLFGLLNSYIPPSGAIPTWIMQFVLTILFLFSYFNSRKGDEE